MYYLPGDSLLIEPGSDYYGNNVTLRSYYLPSGARKSWLGHNVQIPAGTLVAFYVYAHNIIVAPSTTVPQGTIDSSL